MQKRALRKRRSLQTADNEMLPGIGESLIYNVWQPYLMP